MSGIQLQVSCGLCRLAPARAHLRLKRNHGSHTIYQFKCLIRCQLFFSRPRPTNVLNPNAFHGWAVLMAGSNCGWSVFFYFLCDDWIHLSTHLLCWSFPSSSWHYEWTMVIIKGCSYFTWISEFSWLWGVVSPDHFLNIETERKGWIKLLFGKQLFLFSGLAVQNQKMNHLVEDLG